MQVAVKALLCAGRFEVRSQLGRHVVGCRAPPSWLGALAAGACQRRREPLAEPPIVAQKGRRSVTSKSARYRLSNVLGFINVAVASIHGVTGATCNGSTAADEAVMIAFGEECECV